MALTDIADGQEKKNLRDLAAGFFNFFRKGHAKQFGGGHSHGNPDIVERLRHKRLGRDATKAIANLAGEENNGQGGIVAFGINRHTGEEDIYIIEQLSEKTDASKKIEKLQKNLNNDNNRPNTLILIYDHDEMIRYLANHPKAKPSDFINASLAKLADENNLGHVINGKTVKEDIVSDLVKGVRDDRPYSITEDIALENGEVGRVSFICPGNVNKSYKGMEHVPGGERIIEEHHIKGETFRRIIMNHENGHSNDSQKTESNHTLDRRKARSDTEKMADINAARRAFIEGDEEFINALFYNAYWRVEKMADAIFRKAYKDAALKLDFGFEILDADSVNYLISKKEHKDPGEMEKTFNDLEALYSQLGGRLKDLSDMGMSVAYDTAPLLIDFITRMTTDKEFRKKVTKMNAKEFDEFFPAYRAEHDIDKEAFCEQIVDSLDVRLVRDKSGNYQLVCDKSNKNIAKIFSLKEELERKLGVTQEEINAHMRELVEPINKTVNEYFHKRLKVETSIQYKNSGAVLKDSNPEDLEKAVAEVRFFDGFYSKIECESIRNGGDETAAFDKVWVDEHDRLAAGKGDYDKYLLERLDNVKVGYRDEARKRVKVFNETVAKYKETETPVSDMANLSGADLAAAYAVNRINQLDKAENVLRATLNLQFDTSAYEDVMKMEKLANAFAVKIVNDTEALETVGDESKIIRGDVDEKSCDNFPGWIANLGVAVKDEGNASDAKALLSRIIERKRLLSIEITENNAMSEKIKKIEPQMADRLEKIAADGKWEVAESKKMAVDNEIYQVVPSGLENGYAVVFEERPKENKSLKLIPDQIKAFASKFQR